MLANQPARVVTAPTKKYLVVQPSRVNKGRALAHVLAAAAAADEAAAELRAASAAADAAVVAAAEQQ